MGVRLPSFSERTSARCSAGRCRPQAEPRRRCGVARPARPSTPVISMGADGSRRKTERLIVTTALLDRRQDPEPNEPAAYPEADEFANPTGLLRGGHANDRSRLRHHMLLAPA